MLFIPNDPRPARYAACLWEKNATGFFRRRSGRRECLGCVQRYHLYFHAIIHTTSKWVKIMCIAVPAEVVEIKDGNIGVVDYGDLRQEVRLDLVDVNVGEFVLSHLTSHYLTIVRYLF